MLELTLHALRNPVLRRWPASSTAPTPRRRRGCSSRRQSSPGEQWARPVPELARLLITLVDGATTTWLVDRDTAATRAALDAAVEVFVTRNVVRRA